MAILDFNKPRKVRTTQEHNRKYTSDSGVDGTYVPNMSEADMKKWKAKHIKGADERIEIRKTLNGVQVLIVVYKNRKEKEGYGGVMRMEHENVQISMNGKLHLTYDDYKEFKTAITEAIIKL